jgi:hypothetical protein
MSLVSKITLINPGGTDVNNYTISYMINDGTYIYTLTSNGIYKLTSELSIISQISSTINNNNCTCIETDGTNIYALTIITINSSNYARLNIININSTTHTTRDSSFIMSTIVNTLLKYKKSKLWISYNNNLNYAYYNIVLDSFYNLDSKIMNNIENEGFFDVDNTYLWFIGNPGQSLHTLYKYDISNNTVTQTSLRNALRPWGIHRHIISSDNDYVWIGNYLSNSGGNYGLIKYNISNDTYANVTTMPNQCIYVYSNGLYVWTYGSYNPTQTHLIVNGVRNSIKLFQIKCSNNALVNILDLSNQIIENISLTANVLNDNIYIVNYSSGNNDAPASNNLKIFNYLTFVFIYPCFKEGSKILCKTGYISIEKLRKGDLIKTSKNGYVPIDMIGKKEIYHSASSNRIKDQLYRCSTNNYEEVFEDLIITGCHSILVPEFKNKEEKEATKKINGDIYVTDKKYRLPACVDERTTVYETPGNYTIYHFALENEDYYMNYGVYANGLLVETCSKRCLVELAGMELL